MDIERARALFSPVKIYLDTASYGLPPAPAFEALQEAQREWSDGTGSWPRWVGEAARARSALADLLGVSEDQMTIGATLGEMAGLVAASLPEGATVVVAEEEFTSNMFPWLVQEERGVKVHAVPLAELFERVEPGVDLVAVSHVQSSTGEVIDVSALGDLAHEHGARVFVDVTQSCGWLPIDASKLDFVAGHAYKWLLSPRGTGFMATSAECLQDVRPISANWHAGEDMHKSYYGPPLRLAHSARRLDSAPAWHSWVGAAPAIELIRDIGVEAIHEHDVALADRFLDALGEPSRGSAIVSVRPPGDPDEIARALDEAGVVTSVRAGKVRASFHLYNTTEDVDRAVEALQGASGA